MDLATTRALTSPEGLALLRGLPVYDEARSLATSSALRREGHSPELVAAVLTQSRLRQRGRAKLGDAVDRLLLTPDGLEQATRPVVARQHAERLAAAGVRTVHDLGCGLGLDAAALAHAGLEVLAVDADPVTAELAAHNLAGVVRPPGTPDPQVRCARAEEVADELVGADRHTAVWLDPARRTPGVADATGRTRRTFRLDDLAPSWELVQDLAGRVEAAGAKLSPAFPHAARPDGTGAQWVSWRGEVVECVLWWGAAVRSAGRSALVLDGDAQTLRSAHVVTEADVPTDRPAPGSDRGDLLHEPDRAVIRAGLVGALEGLTGGAELDDGVGYVRSADRGPVAVPWARAYRILDEIPLQDKAIRAWCRERSIGDLTLKKRGVDLDPDRLRRSLKLKGTGRAILVLTRQEGRQVALHVAPVDAG
ncbi:class I SAM-dependent methyltransferase [Arsenicicoccus bolidensis]|uniref:class I SAM-dependent methyltransferase n=1 Tax=Arsenicicoccus bolidensis TaxID=229480 RepID=UPI00040B6A1D|nr:class I SAM-dependent methyltransferase [Arsenicicoccus bolidensis]